MSAPIPDFTEPEQQLVAKLLLARYGKPVAIEFADSELQLEPAQDELTTCPTLYWTERGAQFVVCKVARGRYRSQFFYSDNEQFGTGRPEYDDLESCVLILLQVQSDHERLRARAFSGATAADLDDAEYNGPAII